MSENSVNHKDFSLRHLLSVIGAGTLALSMIGFTDHTVVSRGDRETKKRHAIEAKYNDLKRDYAEHSKSMERFCNRMYKNWREMEMRDTGLSPRQYQSRQFYDACLKRARGR